LQACGAEHFEGHTCEAEIHEINTYKAEH